MRPDVFITAILASAAAAKRTCSRPSGPPGSCSVGKCLRVISSVPELGEAFCASWLGLAAPTTIVTTQTATTTETTTDASAETATQTVTETQTTTATTTSTETTTETTTDLFTDTSVTILTSTTGTTTVTEGVTTVFERRAAPSADKYSGIISGCRTVSSRISSACSCFLKGSTTRGAVLSTEMVTETTAETLSTTATETTTATATTTATELTTQLDTTTSTETTATTTTTLETTTTSVLASETTPATSVVPAQPIVNGAFEAYITTGSIAPWAISAPMGGQIQVINGLNPCTAGNTYCAGGSVVIRAFPPVTVGGYVSLEQNFQARPSTAYTLSFLYRCVNNNANAGIDVWYGGVRVGGIVCPTGNSANFVLASGIPFATDATGSGEMEIRFINAAANPSLYFYADDFRATAV